MEGKVEKRRELEILYLGGHKMNHVGGAESE